MKEKLPIILIIVLAGTAVFFATRFFLLREQVSQYELALESREKSRQALSFLHLFTAKILEARGVVAFEDRLQLEKEIADLKDEELIGAWQKFVGSRSQDEAQNNLGVLLDLLISRIEL